MIRWVNRPRKASAKAYWQNPTWTTRWRRWNRRWWREREKESATSARARWCWSFGGNFEPPPAIKISPLTKRASISLSFSPLWKVSKLEREGREKDECVVSERTISSFDSLFERFSSNFFSHQIIISLEQKRKHFSLERERKCLACVVKWEIRNPRQSAFTRTRKQSESDTIVPFVQAKTFYYV